VVLPFLNGSANADMEYLSDGIAETLIDNLSQIPELRVIARDTAFRYKGKDADLQKLGRELSVGAVVTGRVQQSGDSLVVHADLINLGTGSQIWGEKYDRKLPDLLAVEAEIAKSITDKLRPRLTAQGQLRVTKLSTENPLAHQLYLRGRYLQNKRLPESETKAVELFQQAIDLDRNYALAYAGLSDSYFRLGDARAEEVALKALALDDQLAEAHAALGNLRMSKMDWSGAEKELKRAIELNPKYARAFYYYGMFLRFTGHPDQALAEFTQAVQLDPVSIDYGAGLGGTLCSIGQYDRGIAQFKESSQLEPNDAVPHLGLMLCYARKKMYQDAIDSLQYGMTLRPAMEPYFLGWLAWTRALSGEKDRALTLVNELKERNRVHDLEGMIALVYDGLGDKEAVFEWLEKAFRGHSQWLVALRIFPWSESVRADPRYTDLMRRIGFPL
jgi:TolB-like protein/Tfp pilus assembly protein PilF